MARDLKNVSSAHGAPYITLEIVCGKLHSWISVHFIALSEEQRVRFN